MVRRSELIVCDRCGREQAVVNLYREGLAADRLCAGCCQMPLDRQQQGEQEPRRFFMLLSRLHQPVDPAARPLLPAESACPRCGLTFAEFEAIGLVGCGDCYAAFAPAIRHALHVLHDLPAI